MRGLYFRLAAGSMRRNGKFYLPYLLTGCAMTAFFYIMAYLASDGSFAALLDSGTVTTILGLGVWVIAVFAVIFLFYSNSFVFKQRKKEFGLYYVLGMERRHIGRMVFYEAIMTMAITIIGGLIVGGMLSFLMTLLLCRITKTEPTGKFSVSIWGVAVSVALFAVINLLIALRNQISLRRHPPVNLMRQSVSGEREPKAKWLIALLGTVCMAIGYYLAITTINPLDSLGIFFVAVLFVMAGTWLLFTAGSIVVLKLLKRNRKYYYKPNHFTAVSGLMYRMKRNAVGMANICILSTMVLVMVSTTVSLYVGMENLLATRFEREVSVYTYKNIEPEPFRDAILAQVEDDGFRVDELRVDQRLPLTIAGMIDESGHMEVVRGNSQNYYAAYIMSTENYTRFTGKVLTLSDGEALAYFGYGEDIKSLTMFGMDFTVQKDEALADYITTFYSIPQAAIVCNPETFDTLCKTLYNEENILAKTEVEFNLLHSDGSALSHEEQLAEIAQLRTTVKDYCGGISAEDKVVGYLETREENRQSFYELYGTLLFLGIFLGLVFIAATVLILYYKQLVEGYEDQRNFDIMQKVGMSQKEVRKSVHSQMLLVFFLPLITAGVHTAVAFPMLCRIMTLMNLSNTNLFLICTLIVYLIFSLGYFAAYAVTSKVYENIVRSHQMGKRSA